MQKVVFVQVLIRDPENNIIGSECANGTTEDDGATITVPLGYLPNMANAAPNDIILTVQPPPTTTSPVAMTGRVDDTENAISTITLNLQP